MMLAVLLTSSPGSPSDDLRAAIAGAGFAATDHILGAIPSVDFDPVIAAVIDVGDRVDVAAAQTRRWRAELGDHLVPVLWVLPGESPTAAIRGLDAGADAVLARPLDPAVFAAQVRAMARAHATAARLGTRAAEARLLGDQLRKSYTQLDGELEMVRRVHQAFLPRSLPRIAAARFAVCHRPRSRAGGDFYDLRRLDEHHVGFLVGDVLAPGSAVGSLVGVLARQAAVWKEITTDGYRLVPPDDVLAAVNRELLSLGLEDPPLVAMLVATLDARDGTVTLARAGMPAPVHLPAEGEPAAWSVPGPFLGTAEATHQPLCARLAPGDRFLVGSDGTRNDGEPGTVGTGPLLAASGRHRALAGQAFVDAVAQDLLSHAQHPGDFTLLGVEMAGA